MYPHHIVGGSESERHGANKNNHLSFNITSQTSRDQAKNHAECIDKIHACIRAVIDALPGETDARRHQHVERLRKIGNERRLEEKKRMAARKGMRRAGMSRKDL